MRIPNNTKFFKINLFMKYLTSSKGKAIAINGYNYIKKNYNTNYFLKNLTKILKSF